MWCYAKLRDMNVDVPAEAVTDFTQTDFGHPYLNDLGQSNCGQTDVGQTNLDRNSGQCGSLDRLWPNRLWPKLVLWCFGSSRHKKKWKNREKQDENKERR